MDLLEQTRRDDVYTRITAIINELTNLGASPSLVWTWAWNNVTDQLDCYTPDSGETLVVNPNMTEKDVWDLFWDQADKNGFTLEYGVEDLHEHVFDWMLENDILIEDTNELDGDEDDMLESAKEE
jgi:hypothetical protein